MANPVAKNHPRPEVVHLPPGPTTDLDAEITAQPRQLSDELGSSDGGQGGLSVDADELGVRFLSEATEQGEALQHPLMESELSLVGGPDTDAALMPPSFERENTLWEQTVDLVTQSNGASDQLRAPSQFEDEGDIAERETEENIQPVGRSDVRELSLFDREGESGDDTIEPDLESADHGRHGSAAPHADLGVQVEGQPEREAGENAAKGGNARALPKRAARSVLRSVAGVLRRFSKLGGRTY